MKCEHSMEHRNDFKQELQVLAHIQDLDLKIDALKKGKDSLISGLSELDSLIQAAERAHQSQSKVLIGLEKGRDQIVGFREANRRRFADISAAMIESRSQEAFQAKKKEAEELQQFDNSLVEREKQYAQDIETAKKELDPLLLNLNKLTEEKNSKVGDLSRKANEMNANIVSLLAERKTFTTQVAARTMGQYDRVRLLRGGIALAMASKGRCLGCNVAMPSKLYSDLLHASEMHICPRCHRIIYVGQLS